jgi:thioredoxin 1
MFDKSRTIEFGGRKMANVPNIGSAEFESQVVQSSEPVVVDFTATWCPPCKMLSPVLDQVSQKFAGRAKIVKVDIDENSELATKFGVQTIPNLIFFRDGQVVGQAVGYMNESQLSSKIEDVIAGR